MGYTVTPTYIVCYSGKINCKLMNLHLSFCSLAECMSAMYQGNHLELPNSHINIWLASSLVKCSNATYVTGVRSPYLS